MELSRFTLWHLSALEAVHSPFLLNDPDAPVTIGDLHLAVRICEHAPNSQLRVKPRLRDVLRRFRYRKRFEAEALKFTGWLKSHQIIPELWDPPSDTEARPISAPLVLYRVGQLIDLGIPHDQAWAMSPGYAVWLLTASDERKTPGVRFITDEDRRIAQEMEEERPLTSEEQIAIARRELPPEAFEAWLAKHKENHG